MRPRWDRPYIGVGVKATGAPPPAGPNPPPPVRPKRLPPPTPWAQFYGVLFLQGGARVTVAPPVAPRTPPHLRPTSWPAMRARARGSVRLPLVPPATPVAPTVPNPRAVLLVTSQEVHARTQQLRQMPVGWRLPDVRPPLVIVPEGSSTWAYTDPAAAVLEYADPSSATLAHADAGAALLEYDDPDPQTLAYEDA